MAEKTSKSHTVPIIALVLSWLLPGAGHVYLGRFTRGVIIFVTISATFWAGIAMGGVMTVDNEQERWWFIAEMFSGVYGLVAWQNQQRVMKRLIADDEIGPRRRPGSAEAMVRQSRIDRKLAEQKLALVAPTATVARAYAGVAGLLNLMCIFDAVMLSLMGMTGEKKREETGAHQADKK